VAVAVAVVVVVIVECGSDSGNVLSIIFSISCAKYEVNKNLQRYLIPLISLHPSPFTKQAPCTSLSISLASPPKNITVLKTSI
jgi:hypothetical protein